MAHCATCHRTFSSPWGFDRHRKDGACLDPAVVGLVERDNVWRRPPRTDAHPRGAGT